MRTTLIVALTAVALLLSPACKGKTKKGKKSKFSLTRGKKSSKTKTASALAAAAGGASSGDNSDSALSRKVGKYITCVNGLASTVRRSAKRYGSWAGMDAKKLPSSKLRVVYGTYKVQPSLINRCSKAIASAPAQPETPVLTPAGETFLASAKALAPLVQEAIDYYGRRGHKTDKFAQGRTLHPKLVDAFKKAVAAANAMHDQVTKINDQLQERRLVRLEKRNGRNLNYLTSLTMMLAKQMVRIASVGKIKDVNASVFAKALARYISAVKEMNQYMIKHSREAGRWSGIVGYRRSQTQYVKQLVTLDGRIKGTVKWSSGDEMFSKRSPAMIKGHPASVVKAYNHLVNASNAMRFR